MATNKTHGDNSNMKEIALVGAGIAAIAAGAYFFFGPDDKKHQKKMKGWMVRMKGEVLEKIEGAQSMSEDAYNEIVNTVAKAQELTGKIPKEEILALATDLKRQWKSIKKNAVGTKKSVKRISASAKKAAKKVSKE